MYLYVIIRRSRGNWLSWWRRQAALWVTVVRQLTWLEWQDCAVICCAELRTLFIVLMWLKTISFIHINAVSLLTRLVLTFAFGFSPSLNDCCDSAYLIHAGLFDVCFKGNSYYTFVAQKLQLLTVVMWNNMNLNIVFTAVAYIYELILSQFGVVWILFYLILILNTVLAAVVFGKILYDGSYCCCYCCCTSCK